ncbi:Uncharacterized protein SAPIO_CDS4880 [Scedosporium apiospermum]|uniref:Uncharacterized protein n=1 Tax=Pseudallescheria apiosperma TaxID=563466 RepID=A0A084G793_PSEDA|nr:Uncharacterized protein SAPIO_CDS4880 [Scedosporium apiospermum]KEZ43205.1 Uncharacterized protein SAPIO_CDS4880 [Scedosporium apiospermum]
MSSMETPKKRRPSERWTSFDNWDYDGMKERLERFMASINNPALVEHAKIVLNSPVSMSEPFSAGQYWCCFELVAPDGRLIIARVRLPKHPDSKTSDSDGADEYLIRCEVATMGFLQANVTTIPFATLFAYEAPGSAKAVKVGATYMLIEGFYGNTLQDVDHSIYNLPVSTQERIITQWTSYQAELAAFTFPSIGSISQFPTEKGPIIGKLATASSDGLPTAGPFQSGWSYFNALAEARLTQARKENASKIFKDPDDQGPFHFNHMDMGIQNILVDDDFTILAIIDWELSQSVPWAVNHYSMPIPLIHSDEEIREILNDPGHIAHRNVSRQEATRAMYRRKFKEAEAALKERGPPLRVSISEILEGKASRIYGVS